MDRHSPPPVQSPQRRMELRFSPYLSPDMDGFHELPASAKTLYLLVQARPYRSLTHLRQDVGVSEETMLRLVRALKKHKWIRLERAGRNAIPIPVIPRSEDQRRTALLQARYEVCQYKGEFLLREFLDACAFLDGALYNARPAFLTTPLSDQKLEYDVLNPETMDAWELHGFQHFGPSEMFASPEKARLQQANDLIKLGRSMTHGINVVVLTYKNLSMDGILKTLPEGVPRRPVDRSSRYIRTLERLATGYRQWAAATEKSLRAKRAGRDSHVGGATNVSGAASVGRATEASGASLGAGFSGGASDIAAAASDWVTIEEMELEMGVPAEDPRH